MGARMRIKPWQVAVLVLLLATTAVGAYVVFAPSNSGNEPVLGENEQLVAAQIGDLRSEVSTNGSVIFPNTMAQRFGSAGTVGEVLVEPGDAVTEGQVLATLDDAALNALNKAVLEARSALAEAQEALDAAVQPPSALELATARSRVAKAAQSVRIAEDARDELLSPPAQTDLSEAQNGVESAQTALANALEDVAAGAASWETTTQDARDAVDAAQADYQEVLSRWLGAAAAPEDLEKPVDQLLAQWNVDLAALFEPDPTQTADVGRGPYSSGPPPDDPDTHWSEPTVYAWLNFFPGFVVVSCDDSSAGQSLCILREMEDAWSEADLARDALDDVEKQAARAAVAAEAAVAKARDVLARATEKLAGLQEEPDTLDIQVADAELAVARESLVAEKEALEDLGAPPDPAATELLQAEVAEAAAELESALDLLERATIAAPFDGFVSAVNIEPGDDFNANQAAVEIVDPTQAEVDGIVDEIDVLFVSVGAPATVTMDALPGTPLTGSVSFIDSAPLSQQGVVSYPIRVRIDLPPGVSLRAGLSATANIVVREDLNVLLIPTQAVRGSFAEPFVLVRVGADLQERPVQLGNSDDFWIAVTGGLAEGEQVVMRVAQAADPFGFFGGGGAFRSAGGAVVSSSSRTLSGGPPVRRP